MHGGHIDGKQEKMIVGSWWQTGPVINENDVYMGVQNRMDIRSVP